MTDLKLLNFISECGTIEQSAEDSVTLTVTMPPYKPDYSFFANGNFETEGYFVLEYSTMGWRRPSIHRHPCIIAMGEDGENLPLVTYDDLTADGRRYTVVAKAPRKAFKCLRFTFCHGKRKNIEFTIHKIYTCAYDELPTYCADLITEGAKELTPIDLTDKFNSEFSTDEFDVMLGGGRFFDSTRINLQNSWLRQAAKIASLLPPPKTMT